MAATLVFAVGGAQVAVYADLDVFGLLALALVTSLAGGIARDVLIGEMPPASLRLVSYPLTAFAGGTFVVIVAGLGRDVSSGVLDVLDALGLSLFALAGAAKALDHRLHPAVAVLLGALTAVGATRCPTSCSTWSRPCCGSTCARLPPCSAQRSSSRHPPSGCGGRRRCSQVAPPAACCLLRLAALRWSWNLPTVD